MEWRAGMIRRREESGLGRLGMGGLRGSNRVGVTVSRCERILLLAQGHLSTSISSSPYRLFVETSIHAHQSGGKGGKMGDMQLLVCIKGF